MVENNKFYNFGKLDLYWFCQNVRSIFVFYFIF